MSKTLTAADRSALIRLASGLPQGSAERKAILAGLKKTAVDGLAAAKDYLGDYRSDAEPRLVRVRANIQGKAQWTRDLWPSGAPVTKMYSRNRGKTVKLAGVYYGVAYLGRRTREQMVDLFDEDTQTWYSFGEPLSLTLLEQELG